MSIEPEMPIRVRGRSRRGRSIALVIAFAVTVWAAGAIALRTASGVPIIDGNNFRNTRFLQAALGEDYGFDRTLGWVLTSGIDDPEFGVLDHGIRRNSATEKMVRSGGVLAVGGSFMLGPMLSDEDTWPAMLQGLLEKPVANGAGAHYAADQIVLRAEQLLPLVKPEILLVELSPDAIDGAAMTLTSAPKPYFDIDRAGALVAKPAVLFPARRDWFEAVKRVLGYSALFDQALETFPGFWTGARQGPMPSGGDPARITCALLGQLKQAADREQVRMLLVLLYEPDMFANVAARPAASVAVDACARARSIDIVETFAELKAGTATDDDDLPNTDDPYEFVARSNRHVAEIVAGVLGAGPAALSSPR